MRLALVICLKDLRQRIRDRSAIFVAVVAPLLLSLVTGFALGSSEGARLRLVVADLDGSAASRGFLEFVSRPSLDGIVFPSQVGSRAEAEALVSEGDAEAGVILESGFGPALSRGKLPVEILASSEGVFGARMTESLLRDYIHRRAAPDAASVLPLSPGGLLRNLDFFAASMSVLFLTFAVLSGVRALQSEVDAGTIARLRASRAGPLAIYAGKFGALLLIGALQMTVMILATSLLFGTRWGNPWPVAALVGTSVLMAVGLTLFFVSLARNAEQGQGIASISIFLLALIGGQFMPPQGLPEVFDTLNRLTPNGQAFRGFVDLAAAGAGGSLETVLEPLLVTGLVGLAGITFASVRARASLERIS